MNGNFPTVFSRRGFVLPVVLVMLVVMTTVVLFMVRRGTVDERLAGNTRGVVTMESAAQYVLRFCELLTWKAPPGVAAPAGQIPLPFVSTSDACLSATAARLNAACWTSRALTVPALVLPNSASSPDFAQCLIEDASGELKRDMQFVDGNGMSSDLAWRKFRITAEVTLTGVDPSLTRIARAQSEIRMYIN